MMRLLLCGNPNSGKSTLFNRLCGAHRRTGNFAGVTVDAFAAIAADRSGDSLADYESALGNRAFAGGQGGVEMHLCDGGAADNDRLFGGGGHILMYPGALLTDVGYFHHIGVYARGSRRFAECRLVHTR